MIQPVRHDFIKIIAEIVEHGGLSHYKIGVMMHRQTTQVKRWSRGSKVEHYDGDMLLEIHRELVTKRTVSPPEAA